MKKVLITGISGYLGGVTAERLLSAGHKVIGVGRDNECPAGLAEGVKYYSADVQHSGVIADILKKEKIDTVFHFAGIKEIAICQKEPEKCFYANTGATVAILSAMKEAGVPHLIYASTRDVYCISSDDSVLDESSPIEPATVYGLSKLLSEKMIISCHNAGSLPRYHILRLGNVIGAGVSLKKPQGSFLDIAIRKIQADEEITLYGDDYKTVDGTAARDFIDVQDVADACIATLSHSGSGIYNIASGQATTLKKLTETLAQILNKTMKYKIESRRGNEPASVSLSIEKAEQDLGWSPKFSIKDTIVSVTSQQA